jgi:hypothetical protein
MRRVGIEYSVVRNHRIKGIRIECLIVGMIVLGGLEGLGGSELNIQQLESSESLN